MVLRNLPDSLNFFCCVLKQSRLKPIPSQYYFFQCWLSILRTGHDLLPLALWLVKWWFSIAKELYLLATKIFLLKRNRDENNAISFHNYFRRKAWELVSRKCLATMLRTFEFCTRNEHKYNAWKNCVDEEMRGNKYHKKIKHVSKLAKIAEYSAWPFTCVSMRYIKLLLLFNEMRTSVVYSAILKLLKCCAFHFSVVRCINRPFYSCSRRSSL